jgi:hypothetical protein
MEISLNEWLAAIVTITIAVSSVLIHFEGLQWFSSLAHGPLLPPRVRIAGLIIGLLIRHIVEICLFAIAYYFLTQDLDSGSIVRLAEFGPLVPIMTEPLVFSDFVYYSATVYTTLGFGDMIPSGGVRYLTGVEAVLGLLLITWSASFMFLEMRRYWGPV